MLKIDVESLRDELKRLNVALEEFRPFTEDTFENEIDLLDEMNSDFISKLEKVLNNTKDNSTPKLYKKIELFHDMAEEIVETLEEKVDHEMSLKIGG